MIELLFNDSDRENLSLGDGGRSISELASRSASLHSISGVSAEERMDVVEVVGVM